MHMCLPVRHTLAQKSRLNPRGANRHSAVEVTEMWPAMKWSAEAGKGKEEGSLPTREDETGNQVVIHTAKQKHIMVCTSAF